MTAFSQVLARVPPRIIDIPVDAWADEWPDKPPAPVKAGLRLLSEQDLQSARANAAEKARAAHDDLLGQVESFNDHLMAWAVARSLCTATDVMQPYLPAAHENVFEAFTSRGIKRIWEEIEVLHIMRSPLISEATDDELVALATSVSPAALAELSSVKQGRIRRLIAFVLAETHG